LRFNKFPSLVFGESSTKYFIFLGIFKELVVFLTTLLLVLGVLDYFKKRRAFYRELGMSLDEVRREHREEEGDPLIRSIRRSMQQALVYQDLVERVRKS